MFTVLDVSRWQGGIDWDTVKASGRVPGISGPVDLSRTEKDYPALLHRAGLDRTIL